jgi:cytochrome oxidase assembly protein ShyY1
LGYYIVTPLIRSDGKGWETVDHVSFALCSQQLEVVDLLFARTVLINRGWAPTSYFQRGDESLNPNPGAVVTVTGVAREGEKVSGCFRFLNRRTYS